LRYVLEIAICAHLPGIDSPRIYDEPHFVKEVSVLPSLQKGDQVVIEGLDFHNIFIVEEISWYMNNNLLVFRAKSDIDFEAENESDFDGLLSMGWLEGSFFDHFLQK
jgi:hypothetical protein